FANAIFAGSHPVPWDSEGRVILPDELLSHASIGERALFVGLGDSFQIWEPERYADVERAAIELARQQRATLAIDSGNSGRA
ncbi:MAG: division/cell wall cluster transcriptional repressor MraZ, partial [Proteobacteria bacterium]|nr:division/cell wall cluster transcriptional repressor MraZ [Pseudomonadota bacterium]